MQRIIIADTHLGRSNNDSDAIQITTDFFDWVNEIAEERKITELIHLGDFFDNRKSIAIPTLDISINIIEKLNFQKIYLLLGNHDCYYKNTDQPNSLSIFYPFKQVNNCPIEIIQKPYKLDNILLIPWLFEEEDINNVKKNNFDATYATGHLPINEILMNRSGKKAENEPFNINDLSKYEKVFSGHFHQPGEYKNINYIGAPYHMNFNDSGKRGIYVFDNETGETEFIEYNGAPKFQIVNAEDYDPNIITGNNIRLEFYNNIGLNIMDDIIKEVEKLSPNNLNVAYRFSTEFTQEINNDIINEIKGNKEILIDYIQNSNIPDYINIKTLKSIIDSLEV